MWKRFHRHSVYFSVWSTQLQPNVAIFLRENDMVVHYYWPLLFVVGCILNVFSFLFVLTGSNADKVNTKWITESSQVPHFSQKRNDNGQKKRQNCIYFSIQANVG